MTRGPEGGFQASVGGPPAWRDVARGSLTAAVGLAFAGLGSVWLVMAGVFAAGRTELTQGALLGWGLAFGAILAAYLGRRGRTLRVQAGDVAFGRFRTGAWGVVAVPLALLAAAFAEDVVRHGFAAVGEGWGALGGLAVVPAMLAVALRRGALPTPGAAPEADAATEAATPAGPEAGAAPLQVPSGAGAIARLLAGHVAALVLAFLALGPLAALAGTATYVALVPCLFLALGLLFPLAAWGWRGAGRRAPALLALAACGVALLGGWPHAATVLVSWPAALAHAVALAAVKPDRRIHPGVGVVAACWLLYVAMFLEPSLRAAVVHDALRPGLPASELPALLRAAGPGYTGRAGDPEGRGVPFRTWMMPPGVYGEIGDRRFPDRRGFEAGLAAREAEILGARAFGMSFMGLGFAKMAFEAEFGPDGRCTKVGPVSNVD